MIAKTCFEYCRKSFEKFVKTKLEAAIYLDPLPYKLDLEFVVEENPNSDIHLAFTQKEVDLVVSLLSQKGFKVKLQSPTSMYEGNKHFLTIYLKEPK